MSERGALSLPMGLLLAVAVAAGTGLLGVMERWKGLVRTQLRLDACVGPRALELRDRHGEIRSAAARMKIERVALAAALLQIASPNPAIALRAEAAAQRARAALRAEALRIRLALEAWRLRQAAWLSTGGCGGASALANPLPSLPWVQRPDDLLGPRPPERLNPAQRRFVVRLSRGPRSAAAAVTEESGFFGRIRAEWTVPRAFP